MYLRLSDADMDLGLDGKNESNSIENQRELIKGFISAHEEWVDENVIEYVDDGYTGTNFDRPAFKRMIEDAKLHKFGTIIVKDYSRLGREYIGAGDYIEQIFPMLGIRFISVSNNYDSDKRDDFATFEMTFHNLVNTFYSRDLSIKRRSANYVRWKQGESSQAFYAFGYKKDPTRRGKCTIDPEAATIVRHIFELALEGKKPSKIAKILNDENLPSPIIYNLKNGINYNSYPFITEISEQRWGSDKVIRILKNEVYIGTMICGKSRPVTVGSSRRIKLPTKEHFVFEDAHEAIVTREEFYKAHEVLNGVHNKGKRNYNKYPLRGKLRCSTCKRMLTADFRKDRVYCKNGFLDPEHANCCHDVHSMKSIERVTYIALLRSIRVFNNIRDIYASRINAVTAEDVVKKTDIENDLKSCKNQKIVQYEKYAEGIITFDEYRIRRDSLDEKISRLEEQLADQNKISKANEEKMKQLKLLDELVDANEEDSNLTSEMVDAFIDCVYVLDKENIEIKFKFEDIAGEMLDSAAGA